MDSGRVPFGFRGALGKILGLRAEDGRFRVEGAKKPDASFEVRRKPLNNQRTEGILK